MTSLAHVHCYQPRSTGWPQYWGSKVSKGELLVKIQKS